MAERITEKDLEYQVKALNKSRPGYVEGEAHNAPGSYALQFAYGGVKLVQHGQPGIHGQGQRDISTDGFGTKRQLYTFLQGFRAGQATE